MKQPHLCVGSSRPQLSGELLLPFVLTTCNETSAPPHPLLSIQMCDNTHLNSLATSPARSSGLSFLIRLQAVAHLFPF